MTSWDVEAALQAEQEARQLIERGPQGTEELRRALDQSVSDRSNGEAPDTERLRELIAEVRRRSTTDAVNTAERRYGPDESPA